MSDIRVTVAAIVQRDGRFLMVEEYDAAHRATVFNQPAGHLEHGESPIQGIIREVMEETGYLFQPEYLIGTYFLSPANNGNHYLRFCFYGTVDHQKEPLPQDTDILAAHWLDLDQILKLKQRLRSGLVLKCLQDFQNQKRFPLTQFHLVTQESDLFELCYTRPPLNCDPLK